MLEDGRVDDDSSQDVPLIKNSGAIVIDSDVKEQTAAPSIEEPPEKSERADGCDPTAPQIELPDAPVAEGVPVVEGAAQDEHDFPRETQPDSLDTTSQEHTEAVNAPIGTWYSMAILCILIVKF